MRKVLPSTVEPLAVRRAGRAVARPISAGLNFGPAHLHRIEQSHQRCAALGVSRIEAPDFSALGRADLLVARERNLRLHQHAAPVMEMLHGQIVDTESLVLLTDATGTILHAIGDDDFLGRASQVALRPGVNWSETSKGTNAVGTALVEEAPTLVFADEHYLYANHFLTCSAVPIMDPRGNVLGVLDVSGDQRSFHQHTMALVKMSARMIENHWLTDDYHHVMRVHFHPRVDFIGTLVEGILAIDPDGCIVGANRGALEHLGLSGAALRRQTLRSLWGTTVGALVERFRSALATPLAVQLQDGRTMHLHARFNWPVWSSLHDAVKRASALDAAPASAAAAATETATALPPALPASAAVVPPPALAPAPPLPAAQARDARVEAARDKAARVFARGIAVLIQGEHGTGKLGLAREVHRDSPRGDGPFVVVRCANPSAERLEAELFGRGASGDELAGQPGGALLRAQRGSLLLEDIDALPAPLQARLLRAIEHAARGNGGSDADADAVAQRADALSVGWLASCVAPLRDAVAAGRFSAELFDALNGLTVTLPPLRERSDLQAQVDAMLDAIVREDQLPPLRVDPAVRALLAAQPWPGNLRQLRRVLRSAAVLAEDDGVITPAHLPDDICTTASVTSAPAAASVPSTAALPAPATAAWPDAGAAGSAPPASLQARELQAIREALDAAQGNISVAARQLGISRNTIYRKLRWTASSPVSAKAKGKT